MRAVERSAGIRRHIDRADDCAAGGIEGIDPVAAGEPDPRPVERKAMDGLHARERAILFDYFGSRTLHGRYSSYHKRGGFFVRRHEELTGRQRSRE